MITNQASEVVVTAGKQESIDARRKNKQSKKALKQVELQCGASTTAAKKLFNDPEGAKPAREKRPGRGAKKQVQV